MLTNSFLCSLVRSRCGKTTLTSSTIIERLLTLESKSKHLLSDHWGDSLVRDRLELLWGIDESFTDLACKLEYGDKVANTVAKAHRDVERSA